MNPFKFQLHLTADAGKQYVSYLRKHLLGAWSIVDPALNELSVVLVGDRAMSEMHERFMNIPGPTDVLTFPIEIGRRGRVVEGEVIVCVPEARRAARRHGTSVERELLLYALHGMLHLCGFDDRTAAAYEKMHRKEDEILTRLGIGRVFAPAERRAPKPSRRRTSKAGGRGRTGAGRR